MKKTFEKNEESRPYIVVNVVEDTISLSDIQKALLIDSMNKRKTVSKTTPFQSIVQMFSRIKKAV